MVRARSLRSTPPDTNTGLVLASGPWPNQLSLISADSYFGPMKPEQLAPLFGTRHTLRAAEFKTARSAWAAFCAPEPTGLTALLDDDTSVLPFLRDALLRHSQQFPALQTGLSRTETNILQSASRSGVHPFSELFTSDQEKAPSGSATQGSCNT